MLDTRLLVSTSVVTTATSTASAFNGDDVLAWVMLAINVVTLLSNAGIAIYRKWRDRDKDKEDRGGDDHAD